MRKRNTENGKGTRVKIKDRLRCITLKENSWDLL